VDDAGMAALWGRAFLQQGEPYLARRYLERAVAAGPELSDAHSYLALALLEGGEVEDALSHLKRAAELAPQRPLPHHLLARISVQLRDWDRALAELAVLKRLEPGGVQTHLQLAEYYLARGAYDAAEEEYIAAMEKQRLETGGVESGDAALALARFYTDHRGQGCENGLPAAHESLARHQGEPASLDAVGWALVLCGKPEEALSSLESAVDAAPDVARFRYHLGRAYAVLERTGDAREQFTRAIDLDPGGRWESEARAAIAAIGSKD
jgi:tetratricopeptide (TPR) repeat protein